MERLCKVILAVLLLPLTSLAQWQIGQRAFFVPGNATPLVNWPINEGTGLTLHDSSTNADTATGSSGAFTWGLATGWPATAAQFSGTGNALATSTSLTNFAATQPFTVTGWEQTTSTANENLIGNLDMTNNDIGWELYKEQHTGLGVGALHFLLINNFGTGNYLQTYACCVTTTPALDDGNIHFYAVTYDGSSNGNNVTMQIDGSGPVVVDVLENGLTGSTQSGLAARIGARNDGTLEFTGAMQDIRIFTSVLSAAQIMSIYNAGPNALGSPGAWSKDTAVTPCAVSNTGSTNVTCTLATLTAGDLITAQCATNHTATTVTVGDSVNGAYTAIYSNKPDASDPNATSQYYFINSAAGSVTVDCQVSPTETGWLHMSVQAWKDSSLTGHGSLDSSFSNSTTPFFQASTGTQPNCGTAKTPSGANELVIMYTESDNTTFTVGTNYTALSTSQSNNASLAQYWIQTTATSTNGASATGTSDDWGTGCAAFIP